jgi:hypothetical protein
MRHYQIKKKEQSTINTEKKVLETEEWEQEVLNTLYRFRSFRVRRHVPTTTKKT